MRSCGLLGPTLAELGSDWIFCAKVCQRTLGGGVATVLHAGDSERAAMISKKLVQRSFVVGAVALAASFGAVEDATACGGFFCSATTLPINQAAERIIFADN